jgi:hypothetical protein
MIGVRLFYDVFDTMIDSASNITFHRLPAGTHQEKTVVCPRVFDCRIAPLSSILVHSKLTCSGLFAHRNQIDEQNEGGNRLALNRVHLSVCAQRSLWLCEIDDGSVVWG